MTYQQIFIQQHKEATGPHRVQFKVTACLYPADVALVKFHSLLSHL